jgi:glycosyltransferase involved in cell wall biosynthesis
MNFSLIVCTYMRPKALLTLLNSVKKQSLYPNEILIIDGSTDTQTQDMLTNEPFDNLEYYLVDERHRGLTKQRNFGISKVVEKSDIIAFVDDDTKLSNNYFEILIETYKNDNAVTGVGGVASNEYRWKKRNVNYKYNKYKYYGFDVYVYKEGLRNIVRNYLGLQSNQLPGVMPSYSNGRTCGYPDTGKIYEVDLLIGMSFSFKRDVFSKVNFSTYFEGYGLYEDADYSIRALSFGKNVINTNLKLEHFHEKSGRPNKYKYGKMVIRNGWYVWRVKYSNPSLQARFKWNMIALLLTTIRFSNIITTHNKREAFSETIGRIVGWWSLIFNKPRIAR